MLYLKGLILKVNHLPRQFFTPVYRIENRTAYAENDYEQRNIYRYGKMKHFCKHFQADKDQYNRNALLEVKELVNGTFQQEKQGAKP
jgi:hypothetical protein